MADMAVVAAGEDTAVEEAEAEEMIATGLVAVVVVEDMMTATGPVVDMVEEAAVVAVGGEAEAVEVVEGGRMTGARFRSGRAQIV